MKIVIGLLLSLLLLCGSAFATIVTPEVVLNDQSATLQSAIDATPSGGTLVLPPGTWMADDSLGVTIDHPMTLRGWGRSDSLGTIIRPYQLDQDNPSPASVGIYITSPDVVIENLCVANYAQPDTSGTGHGISISSSALADTMVRVTIRDVTVRYMGGDAIRANGTSGKIVGMFIENVHAERNNGYAAYLLSCPYASIVGLYSFGNTHDSIYHDAAYYGLTSVAP